MNDPEVQYCPVRTQINWSDVQFADFNKVEVSRFSDVKYFEPTDSEADEPLEEGM